MHAGSADERGVTACLEVFARFLRLGLTSFGGPVAHIGYFRREFVDRAGWIDDAGFAEILALCSVLPGPSSSQVGIALGWRRAGVAGALLAWLAFSAPSALALAAIGLTLRDAHASAVGVPTAPALAGALDALAGAAAAVVAIAVVHLARTLATTPLARGIAALAFAMALGIDRVAPALQWTPLLLGGALGARFGPRQALPVAASIVPVSRRTGALAGVLLLVLLTALPLVARAHPYVALAATLFRAGSLVFGGGHVVLPFLQNLVAVGRVDAQTFFAGYGAAQAMPGPLFTFAAFLGAVDRAVPSGALGALVALVAMFLPSFLLLAAAVPLWTELRRFPRAGATLAGINAAVVGLLAAVFVDPIAFALVHRPIGIVAALAAFVLLHFAKLPPWAVVVSAAAGGAAAGLAIRA